ncbi:hypothetical protein CEXT_469501 [Caerostris extrusa]|uniref:Uncharacterized protein n=1 Tax=Caerostris extrusa TaxID=172846 RepID=A0AAV4PFP4_CAEEX|nr:hypothetical protein CEXT_469501 [Caerostris extrusa]
MSLSNSAVHQVAQPIRPRSLNENFEFIDLNKVAKVATHVMREQLVKTITSVDGHFADIIGWCSMERGHCKSFNYLLSCAMFLDSNYLFILDNRGTATNVDKVSMKFRGPGN